MNYIALDLEWNTIYNRKLKRFFCEIIEIGAVKLNKNLKETARLDLIVKPELTKRLSNTVKRLTRITNDDISKGISFKEAAKKLRKFFSYGSVLMTWSNTDMLVLHENFSFFENDEKLLFIKKYMDLQKYASSFIELPKGRQIALSDAAEVLCANMDLKAYKLHRALDDCRLSCAIFREIFDKKAVPKYITDMKKTQYFDRIKFKSYFITKINHPNIDKSHLEMKCTCNGKNLIRTRKAKLAGKAFVVNYNCNECGKRYYLQVRFRQTFDKVLVSRVIETTESKRR